MIMLFRQSIAKYSTSKIRPRVRYDITSPSYHDISQSRDGARLMFSDFQTLCGVVGCQFKKDMSFFNNQSRVLPERWLILTISVFSDTETGPRTIEQYDILMPRKKYNAIH